MPLCVFKGMSTFSNFETAKGQAPEFRSREKRWRLKSETSLEKGA